MNIEKKNSEVYKRQKEKNPEKERRELRREK